MIAFSALGIFLECKIVFAALTPRFIYKDMIEFKVYTVLIPLLYILSDL